MYVSTCLLKSYFLVLPGNKPSDPARPQVSSWVLPTWPEDLTGATGEESGAPWTDVDSPPFLSPSAHSWLKGGPPTALRPLGKVS